jgi:hypothetical protein
MLVGEVAMGEFTHVVACTNEEWRLLVAAAYDPVKPCLTMNRRGLIGLRGDDLAYSSIVLGKIDIEGRIRLPIAGQEWRVILG